MLDRNSELGDLTARLRQRTSELTAQIAEQTQSQRRTDDLIEKIYELRQRSKETSDGQLPARHD